MAKLDKKTILVTGGAGFIGSHLCDFLIKKRHRVFCVDNLFTGSKENVKHFMKDDNFKFFRHDITAPLFVEGIDEIYNLACPASPIHYQYDPVETVRTNVLGAINMLDLAHRVGAKIMQASTSEVYGNPNEHPQNEKYWGNVNPIGPRACYDEGKRCAETLFFDYHREYGLPIKVIRIFNTHGPRMAVGDGRVVSNFIVQALMGKDITVYGDGSQTRSFQYIDDLIAGMVKMMEKNGFSGPVNLGNPQEMTIFDLAKRIIKLCDSSSKIIFCDLPKDDPIRRKADISLAKKELKWQPKIGLEQGLKKTIEYFKKKIK